MYLGERPFDFSGRPYFSAIYRSTARNLVLRCCRQFEKSTFLANYILHVAATHLGTRLLSICPRLDQARLFVRERLQSRLVDSLVLQRYLLGTVRRRLPITHISIQ